MNSWKGLAIATSLAALVVGVVVACGGDDEDNGGSGGSSASSGSGGTAGKGGSGTGGSAADSGSGGSYIITEGGVGDTSYPDGFDPDAACASQDFKATLTAANLLFVIDRTGSMNCNPPPTTDSEKCEVQPVKENPNEPSKREITRDALTAAWQGLVNSDPLPSVGVMLFNNDDFCGFPASPDVVVGPMNDPQLNELVLKLGEVKPKGATPIIGATMSAYNYLWKNKDSFTGNKFVVLLTDGAETCDKDVASKAYLIGKANEAASVGIRTFVLGAPGSERERAFLSQIAWAGGTAKSATCDHSGSDPEVGDCHMDMTLQNMNFAQELQKNLEAISGEALSCEFEVPQPGPNDPAIDYNKVNVVYTHGDGTKETIPQDTTVECSDPTNAGWQYYDNKSKIVLCGSVCDKVKSDPKASISIELGCVTVVVPK
ncbi:MAG TPA: vWA domain-containing protein [Polyangiaceae bacterium]|nr:vWA domain-containing protein [Polyangiaceae bacterium]